MTILDFNKDHIEEAKKIALMNYREERSVVKELPYMDELPGLDHFADNGLGVAAFNETGLLGFLCCSNPRENAFNSMAKGIFSPVHAHGAVPENRNMIYKKLYEAAAQKWIKHKITYHSIGLYAHDTGTVNVFFRYGFGLRCIDAIRALSNLDCTEVMDGIIFEELAKPEVAKIREMRGMLSRHLGESPCFMHSSSVQFQNWLNRAETRDSRVFIAKKKENLIAFMEIMDNGENCITEARSMKNICGAFCLPEYRGRKISQGLLDFIISRLREERYESLGVDFESINPAASGFWLKYFTAYTNSVVRRIDECALVNI